MHHFNAPATQNSQIGLPQGEVEVAEEHREDEDEREEQRQFPLCEVSFGP